MWGKLKRLVFVGGALVLASHQNMNTNVSVRLHVCLADKRSLYFMTDCQKKNRVIIRRLSYQLPVCPHLSWAAGFLSVPSWSHWCTHRVCLQAWRWGWWLPPQRCWETDLSRKTHKYTHRWTVEDLLKGLFYCYFHTCGMCPKCK